MPLIFHAEAEIEKDGVETIRPHRVFHGRHRPESLERVEILDHESDDSTIYVVPGSKDLELAAKSHRLKTGTIVTTDPGGYPDVRRLDWNEWNPIL